MINTQKKIYRNTYIIKMINTQNGEDCKTFFDKPDLKKTAHLCKCQNDNPPTEEKIDKKIGRISHDEL